MSVRAYPSDEVHFRSVVEQLPVAVYVDRLDAHSTAAYLSPQIEALTGYAPAEFADDQELYLRLVHPEDRDSYLAMIARRNTENVPASGEYRLIARDGSVIWVQDQERVVLDVEGRPLYAQGYLLDVTERRGERVRIETINAVLSGFSHDLPVGDLVRDGLEALGRALPGLRFGFLRADGDRRLRLVESTGEPSLPRIPPVAFDADDVPGYVDRLFGGLPVGSADGSRAGLFGGAFASLCHGEVAAFLDLPIRRNDRFLGALCVDSPVPRTFTDDEVQMLKEVGYQLAVVLDREGAREELRRRDEILSSVSRAASVILAGTPWQQAAPGLLESLGRAASASRAYIFAVARASTGELRATQLYEWTADGVSAELDNPKLQDLDFAEHGLAVMADAVERNEVYAGLVRDLPAAARALLEPQGIISLLEVPIMVDGRPWGLIGFDDCRHERVWSDAETDALRAAASLVAASLVRERSETVLRRQEERLRANFEAALDAIFITDASRRYVDLNAAAASMLGLPREEVIGRRIDEFLPPERLETVEADWADFLSRTVVEDQWELQRADGVIIQVEASARPNFLPDLNIAFLRDVSERRQLEERLRASERLESIGRLAGGIAHDFNNLLTAISGYTGLALDRAQGDDALVGDLTEIRRAAERASDLTGQLLAFGRRQVLQSQVLDLNDVVRGVESMLRRLISADVNLVTRLDRSAVTVLADPGQLEQVLVNLAVNARDALPGGGTLTISTYTTTRGDRPVRALEVADDGVGMDAETLAHLFEPFYTTRHEGIGLGLSSVHGIVSQSGGEIEVTSEPGRGAVFTVLLPAVEGTPATRLASHASPAEQAQASGATVLLVEDEEIVRTLARRVLEQHGYRVLEAQNGHEAVGIAETHEGEIDALLTDVVMPGLRGHEVADRVLVSRPEISVVYMSGYADDALLGRAADGGSHFLEKPFSNAALAGKLSEALETAGAAPR